MRTWRNTLRAFRPTPFVQPHRLVTPAASRRPGRGCGCARTFSSRLVEAVGVRGHIAAPAAFAHDDRCDVAVEGLADAGLDTAIGGAAADDDRVAPQHV